MLFVNHRLRTTTLLQRDALQFIITPNTPTRGRWRAFPLRCGKGCGVPAANPRRRQPDPLCTFSVECYSTQWLHQHFELRRLSGPAVTAFVRNPHDRDDTRKTNTRCRWLECPHGRGRGCSSVRCKLVFFKSFISEPPSDSQSHGVLSNSSSVHSHS